MPRSPIEQAYPRVRAPGTQAVVAQRARWFALSGAAVWLYAAWAPWVLRIPGALDCYPRVCDQVPFSQLVAEESDDYPRLLLDVIALRSFAPSGLGWMLDPALWGALTPLGVLIAICLWSRRLGAVARIAYALWLVVMGNMAAIALSAWQGMLSAPVSPDLGMQLQVGIGIFAVPLALGLLLGMVINGALYVVWRGRQRGAILGSDDGGASPRHGRANPADMASSRRLRVAGALLLSLGVACWGYSWLFLAWTPVQDANACITVPQDCLGISAAYAMELGGYRFAWVFDPAIYHYAFPMLLVGGAVMALYVAWWPRLSTRHLVGIALWLVLITWAYSVANSGASEIPYGVGFIGFTPASFLPETLAGFGIGVGFASLIPLLAMFYLRGRRRGIPGEWEQSAVA